jgi:hypothetical protein
MPRRSLFSFLTYISEEGCIIFFLVFLKNYKSVGKMGFLTIIFFVETGIVQEFCKQLNIALCILSQVLFLLYILELIFGNFQ